MAVASNAKAQPVSAKIPAATWWMLSLLFVFYSFSMLDRFIVTMLVGDLKRDLGLSDFQISIILGPAFAISYAIFGVPFGWAVDRGPRRVMVFFAVTLWSAATMLGGVARSFPMLLLGRIGVGVGEAGLTPAAYSLLADAFPRERLTVATSIYQSGIKFGSAAAFGLGGLAIAFAESLGGVEWPLVGAVAPWQMVLFMVGAPGFLLAVLAFTFPEPDRKRASAQPGPAATQSRDVLMGFLKENRALLGLLLLGFSLISLCAYSLASWTPAYIDRKFHLPAVQYGPLLGLINLISGMTLILMGGVVDALYRRGMKDAHVRFYTWTLTLALPVIFSLYFVQSPTAFLVLYAIVQVILVPFMVYVAATINILAPSEIRGRMAGIFLMFFTILGLGLGPMIIGFLTDNVVGGEQHLGRSLGIVLCTGVVTALVSLRLALSPLQKALAKVEASSSSPIPPAPAAPSPFEAAESRPH